MSIFKADFTDLTSEDNIIINLYYKNDAVAAPIEYGTATFNIAYTNGTRCEGQEVLLTGIKGLDTITRTAVSDADGNAAAADLDMSYTWTCEFRGITYNVIFEDGLFHTDLCVPLPPAEEEPEEVNENEDPAVENENENENENKNTENLTPSVTIPEYEKNEENIESQNEKTEPRMFTISVTHYLNQAGGGTMVDGVPSGAFISFTESKQMEEGSVVNINDLWYMGATELTLLDGSVVLYNGDTFTLGAKYMTGNNVHDVAADGSMILESDLTVTYSHTFQKQYLTVTMNYLDAETLEPVSSQEVRQFLASSSLEGAAEYDVTGMTPGYYRGYKVAAGYTYRTFEGDALTGEMDSAKVINFLFDKDAPIVEEPEDEPAIEEPEDEPVVEEPEDEPVVEEPEEEPVIEEPEEEPVVEEPEEEPVVEEPKEEPVIEEPEEEPVVEEPKEEPVIEEPEEEPVVEEPKEEPVPQVETPDRPISSLPNQEVVEDIAVKEEVVKEEIVLEEKEATPVIEKTEPVADEIVEIEEEEVPLATAPEEPELIDTKPESFGVWALLNLIALIATAFTALGMILTNKKEKEEDSENENASEEEEGKRKNSKLFGIIPAVVALVVFILTENMKLPMVIIDRWTLLMAVILLVNLVLAYLTRRDKNQKEEAEVSSK